MEGEDESICNTCLERGERGSKGNPTQLQKVGRSIDGQALPLVWLPGQWTVNSRNLRKRLADNWEKRVDVQRIHDKKSMSDTCQLMCNTVKRLD